MSEKISLTSGHPFPESPQERRPVFGNNGGPIWWHHHGMKMALKELRLEGNAPWITIAASAAELKISPVLSRDTPWALDWRVVHYQPVEEQATGRVLFSAEELQSAFGLSDRMCDFGEWLIDRYGGTTARQGSFIRYRNFLNIPCPGTGHDGDPNISLMLGSDIQQAINTILMAKRGF